MDLNFPQHSLDIRAQIQLLKAHMSHKTNLQYEISQIKIKNSYRQSNSDYRDSRDMGNLTKLLGKRLVEVRNMAKAIRGLQLKQVSKETLSALIESFKVLEPQLDISRHLFSLNFQIEADIDALKTYYDSKNQELAEKTEQFQANQDYLDQLLRQSSFLESLENEVADYTAELEQFSVEIQAMQDKKQKILSRRRTSVDKVKIFHQLSDLALSLRSKLLLREELKNNLKNAESELEDLNRKVTEEQEKLQQIEAENENDKKHSSRYEVDLQELQKNIQKKKASLEKLLNHKKLLTSDDLMKEGFEEGETVFLSGWVSGMNEMQKEKQSLMEENFKLKERISRLYSSKA